jgi:aminopeptidase N
MYGHQGIVRHAIKLFNNRTEEPIDPDLRGVVYNLVAMNGSVQEYEAMLAMYKAAPTHEEQNRLLHALGSFDNKKLIARVLELALSKEVRLQDRNGIFNAVLSNPKGRMQAWEFMKKNWQRLIDEYGEGGHLLARLVKPLNHFVAKKDADDIKKFFAKHKAPAGERTVEQVLEHIYSNHEWLKRDGKKIERFLMS